MIIAQPSVICPVTFVRHVRIVEYSNKYLCINAHIYSELSTASSMAPTA